MREKRYTTGAFVGFFFKNLTPGINHIPSSSLYSSPLFLNRSPRLLTSVFLYGNKVTCVLIPAYVILNTFIICAVHNFVLLCPGILSHSLCRF